MDNESPKLPVTDFVVLSLLAEKPNYGYDLEKIIEARGYRIWTTIEFSSIYNSLRRLERNKFVESSYELTEGPRPRKIYHLTENGKKVLLADSKFYLMNAARVKNPFDLGIATMEFLDESEVLVCMKKRLELLKERKGFLRKQLRFWEGKALAVEALFERPLFILSAEIKWLKQFITKIETEGIHRKEW